MIIIYLILFGCTSKAIQSSDGIEQSQKIGLSQQTKHECDMYNSFAYENYDNKEFRSTIDN